MDQVKRSGESCCEPKPQCSVEMLNAVKRIELMGYQLMTRDDGECYYWILLSNAGYQPLTHQLHVCPILLSQPPLVAARTLAHEIGHAISPCNLTKPLLRFGAEATDAAISSCPGFAGLSCFPRRSKDSPTVYTFPTSKGRSPIEPALHHPA
jgi:hypothetical protein